MFNIIKREDWKTSEWAGGMTNEIFIYPPNSNYIERKFQARVSVATTNSVMKSRFTSLPGVYRLIAKLEGKMKLEHDKHYDIELDQYQIDRFRGDWETYSTGKFKDFNLMLKGVRGDLYFTELNESCKLLVEHDCNLAFVFLVEGSMVVNAVNLEKDDFYYTNCNALDIMTENAKIFYGFIKEWD
ncbi:MAG: HutD family protein [Fusobacterium sp.]|nr:HutD family protein [Fusobacterium sp.]